MTTHALDGRPATRWQGDTRAGRDAITGIGIVIPARNEQANIGRCLDAVNAAVTELHRSSYVHVDVQIVVVLDRCTDRSPEVAARYGDVNTVATDIGCVGSARRLGTASVTTASLVEHRQLWLANTDADSTVPAHWLTRMIDYAERGADLILGTVEPDNTAVLSLRRAWHERHSHADGHPHVHGANLGIRASTYLELGGWPRQTSGEDTRLVDAALAHATVRIVRSGSICVMTSSRLTGRTPLGFAHYLQDLSDELSQPSMAAGTPRQ